MLPYFDEVIPIKDVYGVDLGLFDILLPHSLSYFALDVAVRNAGPATFTV